MTLDYVGSILKIILFDLVLSGDNAVVIGLAAHLLPPPQRRKAMIWGCGMACFMRVVLTLVVARLLLFPGLRFMGGVLLAWIACKLVQEEDGTEGDTKELPCSLWKAITRIAMADFIMSLDNVVAIAGVSDSDPVRIVLGLLLSISMLLLLSALIMEIMARYRWIAYLGAAVLAWTAAEMMLHDLEFFYRTSHLSQPELSLPRWGVWSIRLGLLSLCMTTKWWWPGSRESAAVQGKRTSAPKFERVLK
jgi:YjbE family integral membrane protein